MNSPITGEVISLADFGGLRAIVGAVRAGGMGAVYQLLPIDPLGAVLALKTVGQVKSTEQFSKEAEAWLSVSGHPNIAQAKGYGRWGGFPAILSEWYPDQASHESFRALSVDRAVDFLGGMIAGLAWAYERGILHRDIKPANVLVDQDGEPRICDFGLASLRSAPLTSVPLDAFDFRMVSPVTVGSVAGTLPYLAPELLRGEPPSLATELYSLGVTIFELVTGEHPFAGADTNWRFRPKLRRRALRSVPRNLLKAVQPLLDQLLELDPAKRPPTYFAAAAALGFGQPVPLLRDIAGVVADGVYLRKEGRVQDAIELLTNQLEQRGEDPVLLNALGVAYFVGKERDNAEQTYARAFAWLQAHEWLYEGKPYPDPVVNLARLHINTGNYERASELLSVVDEMPLMTARFMFPELGWLYLWRVEPEKGG